MIAQPPSPSPGGNLLHEVYLELTELPLHFRERVCHECSWSVPTFYRMLRKQPTFNKAGAVIPEISNANRDKILSVLDEMLDVLEELYDRYNKG